MSLNVGLIGFGLGGRVFHAPVIRAVEGLRLAAIVLRHGPPDPLYPDVEFVRSVDELLTRRLDLIVVTTPNTSHHPIAKQCLLAGHHVVVDKPFTVTMAESEDLVRTARAQRRIVTVYQDRRYTGDFATVQKIVAEDAVGRVVSYEAHFDRFRPELRGVWREQDVPGAGVWYDLGPHLFDQALLLFGLPEAIAADIRGERDRAVVDDAFDVTLHYPRRRAILRSSCMVQPVGPTWSVHGSKGSFIKYGCDPQEGALRAGRTPDEPDWDSEPPELYGKLVTSNGTETVPTLRSSFARYYENVRDAILGKAELAVTPEWSLDVMRGLLLAIESSRQRRVLPWPHAT
ncbi:MAG TPA: Gfo/Idh/MocA family oxidoreductase [Gemmatimonadales bacterium]|nr:Gfo/Idh/MocA family oxidoreductase [Gemmatimonadales bacterium]